MGTKVYSLSSYVPETSNRLKRLSNFNLEGNESKGRVFRTHPVTNDTGGGIATAKTHNGNKSNLPIEQLVLQELKEGFKGGFL